MADAGGHVVGRDVGGCAARCSQSDREAAGQVEKYFRHEITGVAHRAQAVLLGLLDQLVIGFLKQILKVDQMLEIFHKNTLQKKFPLILGREQAEYAHTRMDILTKR